MKKLFLILMLITVWMLPHEVSAQVFNVTSCSSIPSPTEGATFCFEGSTNTLKKYVGGNWVDMVGAGYNRIQEEGGNLTQESVLNFVGTGVTCTADTGKTTCTYTGGGGSQHQVNGTNVTTNDPINYRSTSSITVTNPSAGNVDAAVASNGITDSHIADGALSAAKINGTAVVQSRSISTTSPLSGGGDLSTNRTIAVANQAANLVLSGPTSGGSAAPTFRSLVDADIPSAIARDSEINVQGTTNEICSNGSGVSPTLSICDNFRIGGKAHTAPVTIGTTAPATCSVGDLFFKSDASSGQNIYGCTATDTWTLQSGSGGLGTVTANDLSDTSYCADVGATDSYACNLSPAIVSYSIGGHYWFKANTANTGAATLQLNGISGPKTIKKVVGGVSTDLVDNDIRAGQLVTVIYDGTNFQMQSVLGNEPSGISGLTAGTLPKAASSTTLTNSGIKEDTTNTIITLPPKIGDCTTNCLTLDPSNITGDKTLSYPNRTATIATTTGTLTNGNCGEFDASGNIVDAGGPCGGGGGGGGRPMKLLTVQADAANAFVDTVNGTNFDYSGVRYLDAVTGKSNWGARLQSVPTSLVITHKAVSGSGGNVSLGIYCRSVGDNTVYDSTVTYIKGANGNPDESAVNTSANLTTTTYTLDGVVTMNVGDYLTCGIDRVGGDGNDSINADWLLLDVSVE